MNPASHVDPSSDNPFLTGSFQGYGGHVGYGGYGGYGGHVGYGGAGWANDTPTHGLTDPLPDDSATATVQHDPAPQQTPAAQTSGQRFMYSKERLCVILRQMNLDDYNPYVQVHMRVGGTWKKLIDFIAQRYGQGPLQSSLSRKLAALMEARRKETEAAKKETGTNENHGEYEQLLDGLIARIEVFKSEKENRRMEQSAAKEREDGAVAEIRAAAEQRAVARRGRKRIESDISELAPSSTSKRSKFNIQSFLDDEAEKAEGRQGLVIRLIEDQQKRDEEQRKRDEEKSERESQMMRLIVQAMTAMTEAISKK